MPVIAYRQFSGEIPNTDPQLLPPERAQLAQNCELNTGSLKPTKGGFLLQVMTNNPVKGIYTDDGINFYTWAQETYAFKSPTIDDAYNRIYFLTPSVGTLNVTTSVGAAYNGPSPSAATTWKAGVPRPTSAPALSVVDRSTIPSYPSATIQIEAWYEYAGKQYDKATVAHGTLVALQLFSFTIPTKTPVASDGTGTPVAALLTAKITITSAGKELVSAAVKETQPARSSAFPGGIEFSLSTSGTTATLRATWGVYETRAYVYTYRNTWLEEGAPSPANTISTTYIQDVQVSVSQGSFTGYRPFLDYKVYRTYGTGTTYLQTTVSGSSTLLTDEAKSAAAIDKALESLDWTPPPIGLQGIVMMSNGWMAGFKGNVLYMSEPYRPHAWPYSITFPKNIRGIMPAQQSIVVTTAEGVHVVAGAFPGSAQSIRLNLPQPGLAQRAMTPVDGAVAYASNDGLVFVSGGEASLAISQKLFTRAKWRERYGTALSDASLVLAYHDGCLIGTSKSMNTGFVLRFDEEIGAFSRISSGYDAMFLLPVADALYYSVGSAVYQFKGGSSETMDWWGRDWIQKAPATFGAGFLRGSGSVTLQLYADGVLVNTKVISPGYFRLPSLPRGLRWSVRLSGTSEVNEFYLAQTMGELKDV